VAREIEELVDSARVSIAHGRMNETELESVMLGFLENESDVLVSTSIIETGVDIPNVNTLIVYNADHMGLSQLYQIRSEEHTSELQSRFDLVCRLLLEKK